MAAGFQYDAEKAAQAVALLMRQPGKDCCAYMKILKLLYVAERESFLETGAPFTGDKMVSMVHGPALSETCGLLQDPAGDPFWVRFFKSSGDHELSLMSDPGADLLCPYECDKLREVAARYADKDRWETRDDTHDLPEWEDPHGSSKIILLKTILNSENKGNRTRDILREEQARQAFADAVRG
jgi:hypothetical protein